MLSARPKRSCVLFYETVNGQKNGLGQSVGDWPVQSQSAPIWNPQDLRRRWLQTVNYFTECRRQWHSCILNLFSFVHLFSLFSHYLLFLCISLEQLRLSQQAKSEHVGRSLLALKTEINKLISVGSSFSTQCGSGFKASQTRLINRTGPVDTADDYKCYRRWGEH